MYHPLGLNIREAKNDTCLPVGGGLDGTQPVAILKGQQVGTYPLGVRPMVNPTKFSGLCPRLRVRRKTTS